MAKEVKNVGASVRAHLFQLSKANGQSFDLVLTRFAFERLLFRLAGSEHANRFVFDLVEYDDTGPARPFRHGRGA